VHGVAQLYLTFAVIMIYTALVIFWMPYRYRIANLLELCASLSILFVTSLLTWFADHGEGEYDDAMSGVTAAVSFTPIAIAVACFARVIYTSQAGRSLYTDFLKKEEFMLLKKMGECLASLDADAGVLLIANLGEWDRAVLITAAKAFDSVALGNQSGSRIEDGVLSRKLSASTQGSGEESIKSGQDLEKGKGEGAGNDGNDCIKPDVSAPQNIDARSQEVADMSAEIPKEELLLRPKRSPSGCCVSAQ